MTILGEAGALSAIMTWPAFSVTSFLMLARLARSGMHPKTIIDVGANIGQFAISAAKTFPQAAVYSYEPSPEAYARLRDNASKSRNIQPKAIALGSVEGDLRFNLNKHTHASSVLALADAHKRAFPHATEVRSIVVQASTLDSEFAAIEVEPPVLLKLDVQGYEAEVLRGGRNFLRCVDHILVEMSFQPLYLGETPFQGMLELLEQLGFAFDHPVGFLTEPESGAYIQMDGLFSRAPA